VTSWFAELAWTGEATGAAIGEATGIARSVVIETAGDRIVAVRPDAASVPPGARVLPGLTIPGLVNAHSHAFHRALRGRTQRASAGDFWAWRDVMYRVAAGLQPDASFDLAAACYAEMALAGITTVGEFHYLHHQPGGAPYTDPNQMGRTLMAAAAHAGIRITLLDTCYLRAGFGSQPLDAVQARFSDGDAERWQARVSDLASSSSGTSRVGAAIHSVRAVPPSELGTVAKWAEANDAPLHVHVSEQQGENVDSVAATGLTPTALLAANGVLGPRTTAVHATHVTAADMEALGTSGTGVCLCPTTERDLADGIGPFAALRDAGCVLSLGSDSHAQIDLFEEARAVELETRLATGRRGTFDPASLLTAATAGGAASLGWEAGRLEAGRLADFTTIDVKHSVRMAGAGPDQLVDQTVFAAAAADVTHVVVAGELIVDNGRHVRIGDVAAALAAAVAAVEAVGSP
jgi:formiminoglutamate deiminase